jgi:hypothetical protein
VKLTKPGCCISSDPNRKSARNARQQLVKWLRSVVTPTINRHRVTGLDWLRVVSRFRAMMGVPDRCRWEASGAVASVEHES